MNDTPDWQQIEWHEECPDCERSLKEIQREYQEQIAQAAAKWQREYFRNSATPLPHGYPYKCVLIPVRSKHLSIWRRIWNHIYGTHRR
jgi:hypothetical protein